MEESHRGSVALQDSGGQHKSGEGAHKRQERRERREQRSENTQESRQKREERSEETDECSGMRAVCGMG